MIIQATTPTHTFILPFDVTLLDKVLVTYAQNNIEKLSKRKEDCSCAGQTIKVTLTQEETLLFNTGYPVQIQVRVVTTGGDAMASKIQYVPIYRILNGDIL